MRVMLSLVALVVGFVLTSGTARAADPITVTFTNKTDVDVTFFLNGGRGLRTSLKPGASQTFKVAVDNGIPSVVSIFQSGGAKRDFGIANGGVYAFIVKDGQIVNSFDQ